MKKILLAGAADRATMVNGCPLGKVAAATSAAIYGTPDVRLAAQVDYHAKRGY